LGIKISCVLPAFDEETAIGSVIERARRYADEVIAVDDGSRDGTAAIAVERGARVILHQRNRGKGAALRTGFKEALSIGSDIVVTLDADGEHDPNEIPRLVEPIRRGDADIVIGTRVYCDSRSPLLRRLSRRVSTIVLRALFGIKVSDAQSGFRSFSRRALEEIEFENDSFMAESEILIDAAAKGLKIDEIPITYVHIGGEFPVLKESLIFILLCIRRWLIPP